MAYPSNVDVQFRRLTGAVPGDRIVGIMTTEDARASRSIRSSRRALQRFDEQPDRWIDVRWDLDEANKSALHGPHSWSMR